MFRRLQKILSGTPEPEQSQPTSQAPGGDWSSCDLDGHALELFVPHVANPVGCVLFLHGHGGVSLTENAVFSDCLAQHQLCAVCPQGGRSWWLDIPTPEFPGEHTPQKWLVERLVPWIDERWGISPPKVALAGVSMGGQGVLHLSYRHARQFPVVAAISPAVDFHQLHGNGLPIDEMFATKEDARQGTVVLNLHPLDWPRHQWFCCDPKDTDWIDGCARLGMKLSSSGILHERDLETSAGGHSWEYFNHMAPAAFQHIANGLQQL